MPESPNKLKLVPYSNNYPKIFAKYQKQFFQSLKNYKVKVHHVGSTAVRGLGGKGFIDILIGLPDWNREKEIINKLGEIGFTHIHPKENERIFLSKPPEDTKNYDVHLHLTTVDSKPYKDMIYFRDCLRKNPELAKEYFDIKLILFKSTKANRKKYTNQKAKFIEKICDLNINNKE